MKKIATLGVAVLSLSALVSVANAAKPGAYAGLGLGASKQETSNNFIVTGPSGSLFNQTRQIGGLGGRIFGGYNFNRYVGLEAGLAQYAQSKYKSNLNAGSLNLVNATQKYSMSALDVVAKGYLPLGESGFNVYGLGGLALVHSKYEGQVNSILRGVPSGKTSNTQNKIRPIVGLGASYDIPQTQLTTNLEYSHIVGQGNVKTSTKAIPSADLLTLNIAYNFG